MVSESESDSEMKAKSTLHYSTPQCLESRLVCIGLICLVCGMVWYPVGNLYIYIYIARCCETDTGSFTWQLFFVL